ncbi:MAG: hypothetical protein GX625_08315 [Clostridiaceae bacterium]|uniref:Hypothetical cytosolic protein n=1 Tax=Syntrophus aciditrophicus (strain SB) TaxID=56780 RepID=Q2LV81_SYNAS|nr:hypothetical protein [Syntrophus aciditrophicus]ABC77992.1 hypothetical cytosolic protein [Syntrophus aciditrophicus SB]NLE25331.1 hypothetical protein [Clostridiaceae bacterium]
MDPFCESTLSAYFPGLVDVCIQDDGQLVYAILKDRELVLAPEYVTETESFSIPEKKHFQFTLPRAAEVMRYFSQEDQALYNDLLHYLKRFSALDEEQWTIIAHYTFLTYLHDHPGIDYCPYILFHAVPERGKSRTGKSIVYVAFRGIHLIELREATIFRYSQNLHGTLFFDLLDVSKKAERSGCEDILLLRYEKGAKCSRVQFPEQGPFNDTVYYDIYGPTIIASNEPLHTILETRCLPIIMPNRPGNYENIRPELALELKERLTAWRAKHLVTTFPNMEPAEGISGRLWDISKPLFLVNSLLPVDCHILEDSIHAIAGEKDESRKDSVEGRLVAIIKEITDKFACDQFIEWTIKTNDIRTRYNEGRPEDKRVTSQWIGKRLKRMSFHNRIVHGYSEIVITADEYAMILKQYGYTGRESSKPTNSLPEKTEQNLSVLRDVERGRECKQEQVPVDFQSPEEREFYHEKLQAMRKEGKKSPEQIEQLMDGELKEWRKYEYPF